MAIKKNSRYLVFFGAVGVLLYLLSLLCTRDFYYINRIPITIYKEKVILGQFYWGFTCPSTDYIILDTYSVGEKIYFYNEKKFDLFTTSSPEMNMRKYLCSSIYQLGEMSIDEFEDTHKNENAYMSIDMYWDWGRFWPLIYYRTEDDKIKYIHHSGIFRWSYGSIDKEEQEQYSLN